MISDSEAPYVHIATLGTGVGMAYISFISGRCQS